MHYSTICGILNIIVVNTGWPNLSSNEQRAGDVSIDNRNSTALSRSMWLKLPLIINYTNYNNCVEIKVT